MDTDQTAFKGELEFIRRLRHELAAGAADPARVAFGDDMAPLRDDPAPLLWTTDMLMDGVDFETPRHTWRDIGHKAMAVNLSDCAAMAAVPVAALCAVALSNTLDMNDALALLRGVRDCGAEYHCPLVGGDTNSWDRPTVICISVAARPEAGRRPVTRTGARPGDQVFLTGPVGGSILGRHMTFAPRLDSALAINRELAPHALIDISDGLALDLWRIGDASGCGAALEESAVQAAIHPDAIRLADQDGTPPLDHALYDGEDFELIVVLPPNASPSACARLGLHRIGQMTDIREFRLARPDGTWVPLEQRGWEHFR